MTEKNLASLRLHMVGCGKMGSALLKSWLDAGVQPQNITACVASTTSADYISSTYGIHASTDSTYGGEDIVILAVKPQMLTDVLAKNWQPAPQAPLYISIAAGKTLGWFADKLGDARVIRAMPNTPSIVRQGVTTLAGAITCTEDDMNIASLLFEASGKAIWLDYEKQMDAAAAVAGSGPAYVFHFAECLMQAAQELGLPQRVAQELVAGTLKGSVALAESENWQDMGQLRQNVTSKNGVTQAALEVLMPKLPTLVKEALEANVKRSETLAKE